MFDAKQMDDPGIGRVQPVSVPGDQDEALVSSRRQQQTQAAERLFDKYDKDHSGTIDLLELPALADYMGLPIEGDDVDTLLQEMDHDGSGKLEKSEFVSWWLARALPNPNYRRQQEVVARNVFRKCDETGDGRIDISELDNLASDLGLPLAPEELARAMDRLDTDKNGTLEESEFVSWWVERSMDWEVDDDLSRKLRKLAETAKRRLSTDIYTAVWCNEVALVEEFLKADPSLVNAEDTSEFGGRYRPLHYAAYCGHLDLCELLVQAGAKVIAAAETGATALFLAAQQNCPGVVRFLLDEGADPTVCESEMGLCAVDVAEYSKESLQIFKSVERLQRPCQADAPTVELVKGKAIGLAVHFREPPAKKAAWELPVQELKVRVMEQQGPDDTADGHVVSIYLVSSKDTRVIIKDLEPSCYYCVQVAYVNGLGAGPLSQRSNIVRTGERAPNTAPSSPLQLSEQSLSRKSGQGSVDSRSVPRPVRQSSNSSVDRTSRSARGYQEAPSQQEPPTPKRRTTTVFDDASLDRQSSTAWSDAAVDGFVTAPALAAKTTD